MLEARSSGLLFARRPIIVKWPLEKRRPGARVVVKEKRRSVQWWTVSTRSSGKALMDFRWQWWINRGCRGGEGAYFGPRQHLEHRIRNPPLFRKSGKPGFSGLRQAFQAGTEAGHGRGSASKRGSW